MSGFVVLECRACGVSIRKLETIDDAIARGFVRRHRACGQLFGTARRASRSHMLTADAYRELLGEGGT